MRLPLFALILMLAACAAPAPTPVEVAEPVETQLAAPSGYPPAVCTAVTSPPAGGDYLAGLPFDAIRAADWQQGPEDAAITILEYSDFECIFCAQLSGVLDQLLARYPDDLRVVYRHYPLIGSAEQPLHAKAALATQAAEAAGRQGKFWEMHDLLFAEQPEWSALDEAGFEAWLADAARQLELDAAQFTDDLYSEELVALAQAAWDEGQEIGLPGTPFLVINESLYYGGPLDIFSLDNIIQAKLLTARQFHSCPPMALQPGASYTATLHTEKGDIVVQLMPEVAPMAVNSFVFLVEQGWFENITFHRVIPGFVAQSGDPSNTGYGDPGYFFAIETDPNLKFDRAGLFAMANSGPTANGSQFFITFGPAPHLDGGYTIFGEVIQGMDVALQLTHRDVSQNAGLPPGDMLYGVSIEVH
ncbi:MAG: peptidylprolyl isomerase [Anaerolineales bacterium]|nr:peptidylprolyl isomerase [Anaerolineales bacterium]